MKVVVVGAGEVGFHLADRLSKERHEVTIIENDPQKHSMLRSKLNALVVEGSGASAQALEEADVAHADLFIAVTRHDEVNLVACLLAAELGAKEVVAGSKSLDFSRAEWAPNASRLGISRIINPQMVVADEIMSMIGYAGAAEVAEFAHGRVVFLGFPINAQSPINGVSMRTLGNIRGIYRLIVTAISRGDETIIPRGDDMVEVGDILYFVCKREDLPAITDLFGFEPQKTRRIFILGGGRVGSEIARRLAHRHYRITIIDHNLERCEKLAGSLRNVQVLHTDGTDVSTLRNEGLEDADVFIAVTQDEQSNMLCSLLAKRYGVPRVIALVDRPEYLQLAPSLGIDACVSPRTATVSAMLKYVRRGEVVDIEVLEQSEAEVIELELPKESPILGKPLKALGVPKSSIVGAVVRKDGVLIPSGDDHFEPEDHVIVFTLPDGVAQVEKFFA
ncbi:Trk system potassium uptake protein TrkA [Planctomycetes bacterium Pan216]|uniref:Trk system potassium uptake protein TrkA n=2 Tax=Kolteria novifilia TaxID=2527975 RepID=A0A518B5L6_9BACT|nr:Trk system potassium uptake protein TrkA [Planctomycetes bacterium Pan216]